MTATRRSSGGTLYLPDSRVTFRRVGPDWIEDSRWDHGLGSPLIVPFPNQPRMLEPFGRSEFEDVVPIADASTRWPPI